MSVVIETTIGDIVVDLYTKERPRTCLNFLKLCKTKYYNLSLFHFVQRGFIAQTGDPTGTGRGGDSVFKKLYGEQARYFEGEKVPLIRHDKLGTLSMVNCGDDKFGSQFFLTLSPSLSYLDKTHCVFGEVVEGVEVIEKLNEVIGDEGNRPYVDIRITHTVVLEDPFDDPEGLLIPPESPSPTKEMLDSGRIGADEEVGAENGLSAEELQELIDEKEAKARATILEMVGDLPEADIAPPENVLFVCKLNQVTTDDDLQIIFSRFGPIVSCEVIRDGKSGESLQYAFIEFEDRKSCEDAYFKMDNVLIDDRRIHVDFSQSVSKYKWRGKGRGVTINQNDPEPDSKNLKNKPKSAPWIRARNELLNEKEEEEEEVSFKSKNIKNRKYRNSSTRNSTSPPPLRRDRERDRHRNFNERDKNYQKDRNYDRNHDKDRSSSRNHEKDRNYDRNSKNDEERERRRIRNRSRSPISLHRKDERKNRSENSRSRRDSEIHSSNAERRLKNKSPEEKERKKTNKDSDKNEKTKKTGDKEIDDKLLKLLRKELDSKKSKTKKRAKSSSSSESNSSSSSSSSESESEKKSKKKKSKKKKSRK